MNKIHTKKVHIDIETFSEIDLKATGVYPYAEHPSTEILCIGWAVGDGEVGLWIPETEGIPPALFRALKDPTVKLYAHNANFERVMLNGGPGSKIGFPETPLERWYCTAAKCAYHALPRQLEKAALALGTTKKDVQGRYDMYALSKPRKPTKNNSSVRFTRDNASARYENLYDYCKQDVEVERAIDRILSDLPEFERAVYLMDQKIVDRGVEVDIDLVEDVIDLYEEHSAELVKRFTEITGLAPTQRDKVFEWLKERGYKEPDITKESIDSALAGWTDMKMFSEAVEALAIRRLTSKVSVKKYYAVERALCKDNKMRGTLMYHGANTGRWAGRIFQPQNLPRGAFKDEGEVESAIEVVREKDLAWLRLIYAAPNALFSSLLRSVLIPGEGEDFYVADFASIEARVLGWLVDEPGYMKAFAEGRDLYVDTAQKIYRNPALGPDNKEERMLGKVAVLALGYGMGLQKFKDTCKSYKIKAPAALLQEALNTFRESYSAIPKGWREIEKCALGVVKDGGKVEYGHGVVFRMAGRFLVVSLPTGRSLHYYMPRIVDKVTPWGAVAPAVQFFSEDSMSKVWRLTDTYGGKLVENIVQAIARDLLCCALARVESSGTYKTVLHVHDEIIAVAKKGTGSVEDFGRIMEQKPEWAEGIPIEAEAWKGQRYRK